MTVIYTVRKSGMYHAIRNNRMDEYPIDIAIAFRSIEDAVTWAAGDEDKLELEKAARAAAEQRKLQYVELDPRIYTYYIGVELRD